MPIQIIELLEVEPRRAFVDAVDVEPSNDVLRRHDLIVAVAPAEAHEIIAQRRGQVAHRAIFFDALGPVAFRKLGAVRPVNQRDVGEFGHRPAEPRVDLGLPGGVGQVIGAANDVRDAHVMVIDHDRQIVRRVAVRSEDDQIVEILVRKGDESLHMVIDDRLAFARRLEANRRLYVLRGIVGIAIPPRR